MTSKVNAVRFFIFKIHKAENKLECLFVARLFSLAECLEVGLRTHACKGAKVQGAPLGKIIPGPKGLPGTNI